MAIDVLSGDAVRSCVSMEACIDLMADTMASLSRGEASLPQRSVVGLGTSGNDFIVMPGATGRPAAFGAKLVSFFPRNPDLPAIQGVIVVFDASSGRPTAIVDAAAVTTLRTAAASGMATRLLARQDATTLALLGCGIQAESHLRAMLAVRDIRRVIVWGRSMAKARAFAERQRSRAGIEITVVPDAQSAVRQADIICTVTSSPTPVLEGRWIRPGTHLNLVGAFTPATREADTDAICMARLFVEIREFALAEAGELLIPIGQGAITAGHVQGEIADVIAGTVPGRTTPDEVTAYKSLGNVAQDLATAAYAHQQAKARRIPGLVQIADFGS
jgi:ornithine cyclodeaminase/alanine dehydrogenase-like protein (mu-crystallin family)